MRLALSDLNWRLSITSLICLGIGYLLKIWRWQIMLKTGASDVEFTSCAAPFLGSIALNNLLPMRAGDLIRAFVFPQAIGVKRTLSVSTLIVERLLDFITLIVILNTSMIALGIVYSINLPNSITTLTWIFLFFLAIILAYIAYFTINVVIRTHLKNNTRLLEFRKILTNFKKDILATYRGLFLLKLLVLSLLIWICEGGVFYFTLMNLGLSPTLQIALFIMSVATLSTLIPAAPGYFGSFHLAILFSFSFVWDDPSLAAAFAVVVHLMIWFPTSLVGICAIILRPNLFKIRKELANRGSDENE